MSRATQPRSQLRSGPSRHKHFFYWIPGDGDGDGVVDNNDLAVIATELTLSSPTAYTPLSAGR